MANRKRLQAKGFILKLMRTIWGRRLGLRFRPTRRHFGRIERFITGIKLSRLATDS